MSPFARRLCALLLYALAAGCASYRLRREGLQAFAQGAYEEAIVNLEQAVKSDPSDLELRFDLRTLREAAVQQLISAADSVMRRPSRELMAEVFPGVAVGEQLAEHGTLLAIDEARRVLGYDPTFSWRELF